MDYDNRPIAERPSLKYEEKVGEINSLIDMISEKVSPISTVPPPIEKEEKHTEERTRLEIELSRIVSRLKDVEENIRL